MSDYKPGTVADATVRGVKGVRVLRSVYRNEPGWRHDDNVRDRRIKGASFTPDADVADVQPLVVLDLHGFSPAVMVREMRECLPVGQSYAWPKIINQIEAQAKPPKPEVYEHLAVERGGVASALCGKVWTPKSEAVTVVGRCPECVEFAGSRWVA